MDQTKTKEMVIRAQKGDNEALNQLFNAYYNDVYYFALKTVKDEALACDITQETFVEVINTLKILRDPGVFAPWLRGITYHQCTRYFKKKKDVLVDEEEDGSTVFDTVQEERTEFIPHENLDQQDFRNTIMAMIDALSEEQRAAILMYYFDEMSVKTIANIQGVSESAVKSRLAYARKEIKRSVEDYEKKNNIRLHSVAILPLLLWLFAGAKQAMSGKQAAAVAAGVSRATGKKVKVASAQTAAAGKKKATGVKKAGMGAGMKAAICVLGVGVVAAAATAIIISNTGKNDKNDDTDKLGSVDTITIGDKTTTGNSITTEPGEGTPQITGVPVTVCSAYVLYNEDGTYTSTINYVYTVSGNQVTATQLRTDGTSYSQTGTFADDGTVLDDSWNSYTYNDAGILVSSAHKIQGSSGITVKTYDAAGNVTAETDYSGYQTENERISGIRSYDSNGNLVKEEEFEYDGGYYRYVYTYDAAGKKISRDAYRERGDYNAATQSAYEYYENGLLYTQTDRQDNGLVSTWTYQYDAYGNEVECVWIQNERGRRIVNTWESAYEYDENGNMLKCANKTNGEATTTETYTYHPNGTMKSKTVSWLVYEEKEIWDEEGRLIESLRIDDGVVQYHYGYLYEEIRVPAEAVACVQAMQENL